MSTAGWIDKGPAGPFPAGKIFTHLITLAMVGIDVNLHPLEISLSLSFSVGSSVGT